MKKIATGYIYPEYLLTIESVMALPCLSMEQQVMYAPVASRFCWLSQMSQDGLNEHRRLDRFGSLFPVVGETVCQFLRNLMNYDFVPEGVSLIWTVGDVAPAIDTDGTQSRILIGVRNSNRATLLTSKSRDLMTWNSTAVPAEIQVGDAYLIDTSFYHATIAPDRQSNRFLLSYGFTEPYEQQALRLHDRQSFHFGTTR